MSFHVVKGSATKPTNLSEEDANIEAARNATDACEASLDEAEETLHAGGVLKKNMTRVIGDPMWFERDGEVICEVQGHIEY